MNDVADLEMRVYMDGQIIAAASSVLVARGAYSVAVRMYPAAHIVLRHRARIIGDNRKQ